ncbi:3-methyladenine DNA glycosylase [Arcanobacterium canis]|uniref:3-methyladenine DNA glycosylase n=1 Tax=Arcanobacterium canis TaxID=999183 RepID=A0ABY8G2E9_9ACTO|nr:3-methyladenine DNA glycosylase [Arcanobacterium canis]WFM83954.1 3-methyladenine DNA glycosylase [Arcanobacterium canis]
MIVLEEEQWWSRAIAHRKAAESRTRGRLERQSAHVPNAMEDFLYEYFPLRPGRFSVWHPGISDNSGIGLRRPLHPEALAWWEKRSTDRWYVRDGDVVVLSPRYFAERAKGLTFQAQLQNKLLKREPRFSCFGWHEWAMVYHAPHLRHKLPLRLGREETDRVVEKAHIRCTHFDAFQFFHPDAIPLNATQPAYETVMDNEQPGCIHVTMDLLRVCLQFAPLFPSEWAIEAYDVALAARRIDQAASPYDSRSIGVEPIPVETAQGRAQYVAAQREAYTKGSALRKKIADVLTNAVALSAPRS